MDEDETLLRLLRAGEKVIVIAYGMGRSEWACYARMQLLRKAGVHVPQSRHKNHKARRT